MRVENISNKSPSHNTICFSALLTQAACRSTVSGVFRPMEIDLGKGLIPVLESLEVHPCDMSQFRLIYTKL